MKNSGTGDQGRTNICLMPMWLTILGTLFHFIFTTILWNIIISQLMKIRHQEISIPNLQLINRNPSFKHKQSDCKLCFSIVPCSSLKIDLITFSKERLAKQLKYSCLQTKKLSCGSRLDLYTHTPRGRISIIA